jgi:hypothetical protein
MVAGCSSETPKSKPSPGVITVIAGEAAPNLNPYTNTLSSRQVAALLFRGLLSSDESGTPIPDLATEVPTAENGGMRKGGTEVVYKLDTSAKWADGKPLTARDVVFTWNLIESGVLTDDPRGTSNVKSVTAVDDRTVMLSLKEPDAPYVWRFVPYVLPEHLLSGSSDLLSDEYWLQPVGALGRTAEKNIMATQVELVDVENKRPTIRVVFASTDDGARHVWETQDCAVWLSPPIGAAGAERSDSVPGARWQAFVMNPSSGHSTADSSVRLAFSQVATTSVLAGAIGPWGLPISGHAAKKSEVESALDGQGWHMGAGGKRFKGKQKLVVNVLFNPVSAAEGDRIEYDMALWRFGGKIEPHATFPYVDYTGGSRLVLGGFDVALIQFPIGAPYGWAWPFDSRDVPSESNPDGLNVARISDPQLDRALSTMKKAQDPTQLRDALRSAWTRLETLDLVLWDQQLDQTVLFKGLDGVKAHPFDEHALRSANDWRISGADSE